MAQIALCTKIFRDFDGPHIYNFGIQCPRERLKLKHRTAVIAFVKASAKTGIITNIRHFCQFFEQVLPGLRQHQGRFHSHYCLRHH